MGLPQSRCRRDLPVCPAHTGEGVFVNQRRPSAQNAAPEVPTILVVDDDASLREALSSLFRSVGLEARLFASAPELLQAKLPDTPSCLVLDIRLPSLSGL